MVYETRKRAQLALEQVLADPVYNNADVTLREKIVYGLESINKLSKHEITGAFFAPLLKDISIEQVLAGLLKE